MTHYFYYLFKKGKGIIDCYQFISLVERKSKTKVRHKVIIGPFNKISKVILGLVLTLVCNFTFSGSCKVSSLKDKKISYCFYKGTGPILVFESGLGSGKDAWSKQFISRVNRYAAVLTYSRVGEPGSYYKLLEQNTLTVEAKDVAQNLHDLLGALGINQPVILIGHSLGGLYVHYFARRYPDIVAGVILIDASSPDEEKNSPFQTSAIFQEGSIAYLEDKGAYPSSLQIRKLPPFPDVPLFILAANAHWQDYKPILENQWIELQKRALRFSKKSKFVLADGSGHYIHEDNPILVLQAIKELLKNTRL